MKVYHIEFAKTGGGLSGGEKCMLEVIKYLKTKKVKNVLLTTDNGRETYEKLGLIEDEYLRYVTIKSKYTEAKYHMFISYIIRIFLFLKIKNQIVEEIDNKDILMCHSDFFPNTIPAKILSKYFKKKTYYWFHMVCPDIFRGFTGQYINRFKFPSLRLIHYKLNQLLFGFLSKNSKIITVNPYYSRMFKNKKVYVLKKFGGEDVYILKKYSGYKPIKSSLERRKKVYDLSFIGRFHPQKGLFEIPKILNLIKEKKPNVKMVLIGGGDDKIKKRFLEMINSGGLSDSIDYVGFISTDKKFDYLRNSKVFIFPSYYESFGQVALEAMANGLPVVAYDLPVFCVFKRGMVKVPILDNEKFANEVLKLLEDKDYYTKRRSEALKFAGTFSWQKTGEEVYKLIFGATNNE